VDVERVKGLGLLPIDNWQLLIFNALGTQARCFQASLEVTNLSRYLILNF